MGTDKDWEKWGATDPYYGVLSNEKFRSHRMTHAAKTEFLQSGEVHISKIFKIIRDKFDPAFKPESALDFGSGVGRMVIAMARCMKFVLGVDISPSMIAEAERNCSITGIKNVQFVMSDDKLSNVTDKFDLIHSYLVLQHIPWSRGRNIILSFSKLVKVRGYLAIQFLTSCDESIFIRVLVRLRYWLPPINWLRNILRNRPIFEPPMKLYVYDLQVILSDLKYEGFENLYLLREKFEDSSFNSVFLFATQLPIINAIKSTSLHDPI